MNRQHEGWSQEMFAPKVFLRSGLIGAILSGLLLFVAARAGAAPLNLAPDGIPILGAGLDTAGSNDVTIVASGVLNVINDEDIADPGPFNIRVGRSVDTFAGATA
jgi:hypothetical protein